MGEPLQVVDVGHTDPVDSVFVGYTACPAAADCCFEEDQFDLVGRQPLGVQSLFAELVAAPFGRDTGRAYLEAGLETGFLHHSGSIGGSEQARQGRGTLFVDANLRHPTGRQTIGPGESDS